MAYFIVTVETKQSEGHESLMRVRTKTSDVTCKQPRRVATINP